jgi:ATP-dependent Clp protease ATP-binding subunit ClpA
MPTSRRIPGLAGDVVGAPTAAEALRKIRELRRELDAFEREQVARALSDGATFATIARDLGVSRQAVHRRFRSLAAGETLLQTSLDARRVLRLAREEASVLNAETVSGSHVVVATLRASDLGVADILRRAGATLERARTQVEAATPRVGTFRRGRSPDDLRGVLAAAARVARARRDQRIEVEHLLLGALAEQSGDAARTLAALGVDRAAVESELSSALQARQSQ